MTIREQPPQLSLHERLSQQPADEAERQFVLDRIFQQAGIGPLRNHPVDVLPETERACDLHIGETAAAVMAAAASGPVTGRTYVVSDGHPPTRGEYAGWLATQLGAPPPVFEAGSGLGKRVRNARAVHELGLRLKYPSYREGLAAMRG